MDAYLILRFLFPGEKRIQDIRVPADLTAAELLEALNEGFRLGIDTDRLENCYLKAEDPIALLRGNRTLVQYGLHHGSLIRCGTAVPHG